MDWTKSYSSEWRIFKVNRDTWADAESVPNVISASVLRTTGATMESGNLRASGDFDAGYYRIVLTAEQGGPLILGTRVDVTNAHMRVLSGLVRMEGVVVGPPEGFVSKT